MIQFQTDQVCIFESLLYQTTATVVHTEDMILVVDPNWLPAEIRAIQSYVREIQKGQALYLLFTHSDYDHIIAWKAFPGAKVIASRAFVENKEKAKILQQIHDFDQQYYVERDYPIAYPTVDIVIEADEQELIIGNTTLLFYLSPGHNPDGIFTFIKPLGIWIAGDYLSDVEFPFIYHGFQEYEKTLQKASQIVAELAPQLLIPGHGKATNDSLEIQHRIDLSKDYLAELKAAVLTQHTFPHLKWGKIYSFYSGIKAFHADNESLVRKEFS